MISNIPIFRARKIDGDEYVKGYYFENTNWKLNYEKGDTKCLEHYICRGMPDTTSGTYKVDPTTLSIHFPSMLDSQGNKIFASLQEDGKGGDILIFEDGYKSVINVKDYKFAYPIGCGLRTHIGCKVIGIQE